MTKITLLQGEVMEESDREEMNIEKMLVGFLRALLDEQQSEPAQPSHTLEGSA